MTPPASASYEDGALVHVANGYENITLANGVWSFSGWNMTDFEISADTAITGAWTFTPSQHHNNDDDDDDNTPAPSPVVEDLDEPDVPLAPVPPVEEPVQEEPVQEAAISEAEVPLGNLPQTGTTQADAVKRMWTLAMIALAFSVASAGLTVTFSRKKDDENQEF